VSGHTDAAGSRPAAGGKNPAPRGKNLAALRLILPYLRPYWAQSVGAAVALLAAAGLQLGLGQGVRRLIDHGFAANSAAGLNAAALVMLAVVGALACATAARFALVSWLGERISADLRRNIFTHVITLAPDYFETARTGDLLSSMTADISLLQSLVGSAISMALRNVLTLFGALALLVLTSPKLAGIVVLVVPMVVVPLVLFGRRERAFSRAAQDRVGDLGCGLYRRRIIRIDAFDSCRRQRRSLFGPARRAAHDPALRLQSLGQSGASEPKSED